MKKLSEFILFVVATALNVVIFYLFHFLVSQLGVESYSWLLTAGFFVSPILVTASIYWKNKGVALISLGTNTLSNAWWMLVLGCEFFGGCL